MSLAKKLKLKENTVITALHAPSYFKTTLGELPAGVTIKTASGKASDFIILFVRNKAELEKDFPKAAKTLNPGALIWIAYPKTTSKMQTDLSRDKGWESLEKYDMQWLSLISFDDSWSAFSMRNEPKKKENKAADAYHDLVATYVDTENKTVKLPDDVKTALSRNKKAAALYDSLAYSHRKEYIIWIVSAKQEATRKSRVEKMMEKLVEGKKNPGEK